MSTPVDPRILAKLTAFAHRRRKLIIIRGVCAGIGMLLATMMLVALLDLIFVLPDEARWGLSAAAYLAVLIAEWRTCLRLLAHAPGPRRLARLLEHAEPKLREDLLSAVELGSQSEQAIFDSDRFRQLVQTDVAERMEDLDVERLLPVQLVRRAMGVAAIVIVALLVAFIFTGAQVGTLLVRALLPMANLARVSRFKVEIVEPQKPEQIVPHGETVPLKVRIRGGHTQKAVLETFTAAGGRDVVQMTPEDADTFIATIQVGREDVKYRIRAGDAITRKYLLDAEARPHVALFRKVYHYPGYTRLSPKEVTEETGDLEGLEGSSVEVSLVANQPIATGEIRVDEGPKSFVVPLQLANSADKNAAPRLTAMLPLDASGSYRVHLRAQRTGFENKFSPEYEIRAQPDLVPEVELDAPEQDLILPANEAIDLRGHASDDQALASVMQLVRVNESPWQEVLLSKDPGMKVDVERRWDLFEQGVKAGDLVTCKLRATDLKGSIAESRAFQITVTQAGFESKRLQTLAMQRAALEMLKQIRVASEAFEKQGRELQETFGRHPENDPQRKQAALAATTAHTEWERVADEGLPQLIAALRVSAANHESADLVLVGRLLGRMQKSAGNEARDALGVLGAEPAAKNAQEQAASCASATGRVLQRVRLAEESYQTFLAAEELDVLTENAQIVAREQQRILALAGNSGQDPSRWAVVGKRLRVVLAEIRGIEELMAACAPRLRGGYSERLMRHRTNLNKQRVAAEQLLAKNDSTSALMEPTKNLAKISADQWRELLAMKRETVSHPVQTVTQVLTEIQPTYANLEKLCQDLRLVATNDALTDATRQQLRDWKWASRTAHFKLHGDLEEARPSSDAAFVGDVRAATLALDALGEKQRGLSIEEVESQVRRIDERFRLLEVAHNVAEVAEGLQRLAAAERWEVIAPHARTTQPRDWEWLEARLKSLPDELSRLAVAEPSRKAVAEAQKLLRGAVAIPGAQRVNQEMKERFQPGREPVAVAPEAESIAEAVAQALNILRTPIDQAREQLAALAPKLHEMMAQLATRAEELKTETTAQAEKTAREKAEEAQPEAAQALARQEALNEKLDTLKDALRSEANKQDILQAEGREKARDVDDALALLKEPPERAAQALQQAARTAEATPRQERLQSAAAQQQKLAQSLQQLAAHFENAAKGDAAETRTALRATEEQTGVKDALDAQYAQAAQLAQLAQASPQDLLAQLERALPQNPVMQKELDSISANLLATAEQQLAQASRQETEVASKVAEEIARQNQPQRQAAANAAQAAKQAAQAANNAKQAATNAREQAKEAGNDAALQQAQRAMDQAAQAATAADRAARAAEDAARMIENAQTQPAAQSAQQAAAQAGDAAKAATQAATDARQAQAEAQQGEQKGGEKVANNRQSAQQSAEAVKAAEMAAQAAQTAQAAAKQMADAAAQQIAAAAPSTTPATPTGSPSAASPQLAQNAHLQTPIGETTRQAGDGVSRAGRHETRLQNPTTGEQLDGLGQEIRETASVEIPAAAQALSQAQSAMQAQPAVNAAKSELAAELGQLQSITNSGTTAQSTAQSPPSNASPSGQPPTNAPSAGQAPGNEGAQPAPNASRMQAQSGKGTPPGSSQGEPGSAKIPAEQRSGSAAAAAAANAQGAPGENGNDATQQAGNTNASAPAAPQQQVWMARTLDALDAALNGTAPAENGQSAQNGPPSNGQPQQGTPNGAPGKGSPSLADAKSAMNAAAQAAAAQMRGSRANASSDTPAGNVSMSDAVAKSKGGVKADGTHGEYAALPDARTVKSGEWGKLPKKLAEELTQGQRESVAGEYREQIETYYRVIAEKSKAP